MHHLMTRIDDLCLIKDANTLLISLVHFLACLFQLRISNDFRIRIMARKLIHLAVHQMSVH